MQKDKEVEENVTHKIEVWQMKQSNASSLITMKKYH